MRIPRIPVWLKVFALAILVVLLVRTFAVTSCSIPFTGMENTLYQGERVLVNKWSYGLRLPFSTFRLRAEQPRKGDVVLFNNPLSRNDAPVYARELFISRCVGVPGDTLMMDDQLLVTGKQVQSPDSKQLYVYPHSAEDTLMQVMKELGIADNPLVGYASGNYIRSFSHYEHYLLRQRLGTVVDLHPVHANDSAQSHPFVIPQKGKPVKVYPWNKTLLCNTIIRHEHRKASVKGDTLYVEGKPVEAYAFQNDYYWMASNNPLNLSDSRLFGLVPFECLVGKAYRIWYSSDKDRIFQLVQ